MILAGDVYDAVLTVDEEDDDAVEFSRSNCCTCRISTYSSSWFWEDDEINAGFGRLPLKDVNNYVFNAADWED